MTLMPQSPAPEGGAPEKRPRGARAAWIVALSADALQWAILPLFAPGVASPVNDALDVGVAIVLVRLLGWHWAFLPAFIAEVVPGVDLVPTWTLAVWIASRSRRAPRRPG